MSAGGIAAFAAVTLVTTGFATWIIGNQAQEQEGNINIAIDTAKNSAEAMIPTGFNSPSRAMMLEMSP